MITLVGNARAVEVIRAELATVVAPAVSDTRAAMSLQMIDSLLGQLERLIDYQGAWMREEIDAIAAIAERVTNDHPDRKALADPLRELRARRAPDGLLPELRAEYHQASELLSRMIEDLSSTPGELQDAALALLSSRLDRELMIRGEFQLVGQAG